jgi:sugar/nucleoside kinase (ribokinase family)
LLPDFFVDHFVYIKNKDAAIKKISDIYEQNGGNIPNISQNIKQGGNAANTALALQKLGINSHLICKTDKFGFYLLKYFLGRYGVKLTNVKTDGELAITTALEFGDSHVNVMMGDTGSVANFSFEYLE